MSEDGGICQRVSLLLFGRRRLINIKLKSNIHNIKRRELITIIFRLVHDGAALSLSLFSRGYPKTMVEMVSHTYFLAIVRAF